MPASPDPQPRSAPAGVRARVREELTREIKAAARKQMAESGSAGLSLRAVARELGMASSAVYRYFPSRDELLTALIVDAYSAVAGAAETAEADQPRADFSGRWLAAAQGVRGWAQANPQEYALIFGSPVPGYRAPQDTIDPAARIPLLLIQIVADAAAAGQVAPVLELPPSVQSDLAALRAQIATNLDESTLARAAMGWMQLVGSISFELFGHLNNVIHGYAEYFDFQMEVVAAELGL
jgi:AcrR family transcriptional regulator